MSNKKINSALISVYYKDGLADIARMLNDLGVKIFSTGGTFTYIKDIGIPVESVESLTTYPAILGGRVKTLHPSVFGGILAKRGNNEDSEQLSKYNIPEIDLVVVDLYPFEETVAESSEENDIIEKIDIGGISLIRAGAKNYNDVLIVSARSQYPELISLLDAGKGETSLAVRRHFATEAFKTTSHYDTAIFKYYNRDGKIPVFRESINSSARLRYGENPHQQGVFFGDLEEIFDKLHGREISYNNLLDIDAAINLIDEFTETTFAIIKHNNACGIASRNDLLDAWKDALACDPVSAFGGILITNSAIDEITATEIDKIFFEIIVAPRYSDRSLEILMQKKNRIILLRKRELKINSGFRSLFNGVLWQEKDNTRESMSEMRSVTIRIPEPAEFEDLIFANIVVKHSKSNAIVLAKNKQLYASGIGQTSRVDALKQAIEKAHSFGFNLKGSVMASDAFFPFPDCVEIANKAGVTSIVEPGGSVKDNESIDYCNRNGVAMVFTGIRHFKH
jgi:phosphoribosylaminoimidazolecarboxamide formyltransferase/IMP cyclohydrolase